MSKICLNQSMPLVAIMVTHTHKQTLFLSSLIVPIINKQTNVFKNTKNNNEGTKCINVQIYELKNGIKNSSR